MVGTTAVAVCILFPCWFVGLFVVAKWLLSLSLSLSFSLFRVGNPSERAIISDSSASPCCAISLLAENSEVARWL